MRRVVLSEWVSVLFSEPKIPQSLRRSRQHRAPARFSALQRAENSSICRAGGQGARRLPRFSALQRAENSSILRAARQLPSPQRGFSALQRAENSSIQSAVGREYQLTRFSALQRAENSSIGVLERVAQNVRGVSVLFSEPKIPQSATAF